MPTYLQCLHLSPALLTEVGDEVTKDEPLTTNPNVGGFGQVPALGTPTALRISDWTLQKRGGWLCFSQGLFGSPNN